MGRSPPGHSTPADERLLKMAKDVELVETNDAVPLGDADLGYGRTATRLMIAGAVWSLWEQLQLEKCVDQQWLADRLGKDKSRVSRLLKGPGNWTLDTVADLLEAMEGRLTHVEARFYRDIAATSPIEPCLSALRESGKLWNVLEVKFESADTSALTDPLALDASEADRQMIFVVSPSKSRPIHGNEEAK
jgi:hypothetical protein